MIFLIIPLTLVLGYVVILAIRLFNRWSRWTVRTHAGSYHDVDKEGWRIAGNKPAVGVQITRYGRRIHIDGAYLDSPNFDEELREMIVQAKERASFLNAHKELNK